MEFWKGIRGNEVCISQISCQKTNLKSRHGWLNSIQVRKTGTIQLELAKQEELEHISYVVPKEFQWYQMYGATFTASTRHKQSRCGNKIEKIIILKERQKREKWKCSIWPSPFMDGTGNCYWKSYCCDESLYCVILRITWRLLLF
jgi:hypothetical protein